MANTGGFYSFYQHSHDGVNFAAIGWVSGATGALPASFPGGAGWTRVAQGIFKSITRTGTGAYTLVLIDPWYAPMFGYEEAIVQASYANTGACFVQLIQDFSNNVATPQIKILITNAAGTAVDSTTNDTINLVFALCIKPSY
jgi:hypothetical protein